MTTRALVLTLLTLALSGCAAWNPFFHVPAQPAVGTVAGHVLISACPGPLAAGECPPRPAPGVVIAFSPERGGQAVTTATRSDGSYSASLAAGTYAIIVGGRTPGGDGVVLGKSACPPVILANPVGCPSVRAFWPVQGPRQISVEAGQRVTADYSIIISTVYGP